MFSCKEILTNSRVNDFLPNLLKDALCGSSGYCIMTYTKHILSSQLFY